MTTFLLKSLGCKVSQYDGERLAEKLRVLGLAQVEETPDIFILNGCSVTGRASQKVRQTLRAAKRRWPAVKLVLTGCEARLLTQRNEELVEIDWLLKDAESASISDMLAALALDVQAEAGSAAVVPVTARTRAFLKVQDGCSQFCSYCIVAHLRGPEWSRPIADAVAEASRLVEEGHRELVLTGIHLGHYQPSLLPLLKELEKLPGLDRIRLSSIESVEVSDELLDWAAESPKACAHMHLPLQSGSDTILRAMRRPYDTVGFAAVVARVRARMPFAAVTTDLIVGFPGETDELFGETLKFLEEMQFSRIHIFKFSPRDGTPAATMSGQIDNATKTRRSEQVETVWHKSAQAFYQRFIGRELEILWETSEAGTMQGFSREYIPCFMPVAGLPDLNQISRARGVSCTPQGLLVTASS
ncbi:MAG: hypothetical protein A2W80_02120 [Candidatus Riflebacteria bacterium GWC2_50_8]|nr:MAG: hypothetical protein A2W80_02120 [Candidatus Riflebacteria bacterium GWC2_50_8]